MFLNLTGTPLYTLVCYTNLTGRVNILNQYSIPWEINCIHIRRVQYTTIIFSTYSK